VGRVTGRALLLSANVQLDSGLIAGSPREALEAFLGADIDYLFLGNQLGHRAEGRRRVSLMARKIADS
jgi:hypothetical protein